MKKRVVIAAIMLFVSLFNYSFGQISPGGEAGGSGTESLQPAPVSFKRNNGNGTCPAQAEIRVEFNVLPQHLPIIAQVRSEQRNVDGIVIGNVDTTSFAAKGYVSYCISSANIIPATKLWIRFHYERTNQDFWLSENESYNKAISQQ